VDLAAGAEQRAVDAAVVGGGLRPRRGREFRGRQIPAAASAIPAPTPSIESQAAMQQRGGEYQGEFRSADARRELRYHRRHEPRFVMPAWGCHLPPRRRRRFYDLDGAYRCLKSPDPDCEKGLNRSSAKPPPAPPSKPVDRASSDIIAHVPGPRPRTERHRQSSPVSPPERSVARSRCWRGCKAQWLGTARAALAAYRL